MAERGAAANPSRPFSMQPLIDLHSTPALFQTCPNFRDQFDVMTSMLRFQRFKSQSDDEALTEDFLFRTRTVCIHSSARPKDIRSKNLARLRITCRATGTVIDDVFCVDARGSRKNFIRGHAAHFRGIEDGAEIAMEITPASEADCIVWLRQNADPERQVFGQILAGATEARNQVAALTRAAQENFRAAEEERALASLERKKGILYGTAGFLGGACLDLGLLEDKLGIVLPLWLMLLSLIVAVALPVYALSIRRPGNR